MNKYGKLQEMVEKYLSGEFSRDKNGNYFTEIYTDYNDCIGDSTVAEILNSPNPSETFYEKVDEAYFDSAWRAEENALESCMADDDFKRFIESNNISEDDVASVFYDKFYVKLPYDAFLKQNVCMDIILDTGDCNYDFTCNDIVSVHDIDDIDDNSSLLWLCAQQGVSKEELFSALKKGSAHSDEIINLRKERADVIKQLENVGYRQSRFNETARHTGQYAVFKESKDDLDVLKHKTEILEKNIKKNDISYEEYLALHHDKYESLIPVSRGQFDKKKEEGLAKFRKELKSAQSEIDELEKVVFGEFSDIVSLEHRLRFVNAAIREEGQSPEFKKANFVDSLRQESLNTTTHMNALTFLVKMPLQDAIRIAEIIGEEEICNSSYYADERTGKSSVTLDKDVRCGLFDEWNGAGSVLEVEPHKDVEIPIKYIYKFTPDNALNYGVMRVYGADMSFYSDSLKSVTDRTPEKDINKLIDSAFGRSAEEQASLELTEPGDEAR